MNLFPGGGNRNADQRKPIVGVMNAKVEQNYDKEHPGMVKVKLLLYEEGYGVTEWARVAMTYAGNGYGGYVLPEIGDEVLVAFGNGDLREPYIIGSLFNTNNVVPEETSVDLNNIKRFKSRQGNDIVISDEKGKEAVTVTTTKGFSVKLEDEPQTVTVTDPDGKNIIVLNAKDGLISITADKKIALKAGSVELTLDGQGNKLTAKAGDVQIDGSSSIKTKGTTTEIAGTQITIKADATLTAQASGNTVVKGAIVQIN